RSRLAVRQTDQRERLLERVTYVRDTFLRDGGLDDAGHARVRLVAELHGSAASRLGIGAGQLQARLVGIEERLDRDAQPSVGRDFRETRHRHRAERLSVVGGGDVDHVLIALRRLGATDHDVGPVLASRIYVAVAQRREEFEPLRVLGAAEHRHRRLALVAVFRGEIGERLDDIGRLRVARRRSGEPRHGQQQQQERMLHQAFFWYVPLWLIQSHPLSGLVYLDHGSGSTLPFVREMILNWPFLRISPMSTGRYVCWLYSCILMVPTGAANVWP